EKVHRDVTTCIPAFGVAKVVDSSVIRVKEGVTHFFPGSYQHLLSAETEIPNLYMSGDWIITRHGSWSQEKAYVTGLEAANLVVEKFGMGSKANIIPIEPDEPHIQVARNINQTIRDFTKFLPSFW
ncbi:MAG: FAD-dependent oxidoreductase, partial [Cyanobacteria bacterium J06638_38]